MCFDKKCGLKSLKWKIQRLWTEPLGLIPKQLLPSHPALGRLLYLPESLRPLYKVRVKKPTPNVMMTIRDNVKERSGSFLTH